jgi:hypothetical protein
VDGYKVTEVTTRGRGPFSTTALSLGAEMGAERAIAVLTVASEVVEQLSNRRRALREDCSCHAEGLSHLGALQ